MRAKTLTWVIALLCACQDDKGGDTSGTEADTSGAEADTTATSTATATATSTATATGAESEGDTSATEAGGTTAADETSSSGGPAVECEDLLDEASCEGKPSAGGSCRWLEVRQLTADMCVFGTSTARCVDRTVNDGGCSACMYKDLGNGQFEVIELPTAPEDISCQNNAEFSSCYYWEDAADPPACACMCKGNQL